MKMRLTGTRHDSVWGWSRALLLIAVPVALVACATTEERSSESAGLPSTQVYFYPTRGQSADQQERDRYECYLWARKQTGFDPSLPGLAPHQRLEMVPAPPPGHETASGAITGAIIGSVVAPVGRGAEGAVVGAVAGAMIGAASEAARRERYDRRTAQRFEQQAADYRRAMTACLEGRGYTVR